MYKRQIQRYAFSNCISLKQLVLSKNIKSIEWGAFENCTLLEKIIIYDKVEYLSLIHIYRMLVSVCYLVLKGLLQTQSDGTTKLMDFLDEQRMHLSLIHI